MEFGGLVLYSKDPARLSQFFSFLFDVPVERAGDNYQTELAGVRVEILACASNANLKKPGFKLQVDSPIELEELKQKCEFYFFKNDLHLPSLKLDQDKLDLQDTDGRHWSFNVRPMASKEKLIPDNVRLC